MIQMLFCTSLVCLVGSGERPGCSRRVLRLFNTKTEKFICELNFVTNILNVQINRGTTFTDVRVLGCVVDRDMNNHQVRNWSSGFLRAISGGSREQNSHIWFKNYENIAHLGYAAKSSKTIRGLCPQSVSILICTSNAANTPTPILAPAEPFPVSYPPPPTTINAHTNMHSSVYVLYHRL